MTALLFATACSVAACERPGTGRVTESATDAAPTADTTPEPAPAPASLAHASVPPLAPPLADAPTDEFVGWYFEKGGTSLLMGCGQGIPLEVTDPAFLNKLNAQRGGAKAPVFVRLAVRPGAGSKLEVAKIEQFGVDEGPAPDCALGLAP
jgi:hypothetical protein